jgi:hypothetical protein
MLSYPYSYRGWLLMVIIVWKHLIYSRVLLCDLTWILTPYNPYQHLLDTEPCKLKRLTSSDTCNVTVINAIRSSSWLAANISAKNSINWKQCNLVLNSRVAVHQL